MGEIQPMHYVFLAIANIGAALLAGVSICWFLAHQRVARLSEQLNEFTKVVSGFYEDESDSIWLEAEDRTKRWEEMLKDITSDAEKGADRLVRLNARSKRDLENLLHNLHQVDAKALLNVLYGDESGPKPKTIQEKVLERISKYEQALGILSFFEAPRTLTAIRRRFSSPE